MKLKEMLKKELKESDFDAKDERRINDMINKSKDDAHLLRLAKTMASRIKDKKKAVRRARAAEDINYHDVAKVFYDRAEEL
jgi:hypothetical protein